MFKNQFLFVVGLVFAVIISVFAITNADPVEINLLFTTFQASQALLVFLSAASGAIIVVSLGLIRHLKLTGQLRTMRKENDKLRNQIKFLEEQRQTKADQEKAAQEAVKATPEPAPVPTVEEPTDTQG
jgi:uncharacterized integral membrane protein